MDDKELISILPRVLEESKNAELKNHSMLYNNYTIGDSPCEFILTGILTQIKETESGDYTATLYNVHMDDDNVFTSIKIFFERQFYRYLFDSMYCSLWCYSNNKYEGYYDVKSIMNSISKPKYNVDYEKIKMCLIYLKTQEINNYTFNEYLDLFKDYEIQHGCELELYKSYVEERYKKIGEWCTTQALPYYFIKNMLLNIILFNAGIFIERDNVRKVIETARVTEILNKFYTLTYAIAHTCGTLLPDILINLSIKYIRDYNLDIINKNSNTDALNNKISYLQRVESVISKFPINQTDKKYYNELLKVFIKNK